MLLLVNNLHHKNITESQDRRRLENVGTQKHVTFSCTLLQNIKTSH